MFNFFNFSISTKKILIIEEQNLNDERVILTPVLTPGKTGTSKQLIFLPVRKRCFILVGQQTGNNYQTQKYDQNLSFIP